MGGGGGGGGGAVAMRSMGYYVVYDMTSPTHHHFAVCWTSATNISELLFLYWLCLLCRGAGAPSGYAARLLAVFFFCRCCCCFHNHIVHVNCQWVPTFLDNG